LFMWADISKLGQMFSWTSYYFNLIQH
jgi:hypothetical protein